MCLLGEDSEVTKIQKNLSLGSHQLSNRIARGLNTGDFRKIVKLRELDISYVTRKLWKYF